MKPSPGTATRVISTNPNPDKRQSRDHLLRQRLPHQVPCVRSQARTIHFSLIQLPAVRVTARTCNCRKSLVLKPLLRLKICTQLPYLRSWGSFFHIHFLLSSALHLSLLLATGWIELTAQPLSTETTQPAKLQNQLLICCSAYTWDRAQDAAMAPDHSGVRRLDNWNKSNLSLHPNYRTWTGHW